MKDAVKTIYSAPEVEVIALNQDNVIRTSSSLPKATRVIKKG